LDFLPAPDIYYEVTLCKEEDRWLDAGLSSRDWSCS